MPPMRLWLSIVLLTLFVMPIQANHFPPSFEDAPLHAVTFVDKTEGWAVGDHGVIWHTIDGGKQWERQKSGTRASLRSVQFLTPYSGFAVGRTELPKTLGHSTGIVLATTDGGLTWTEVSNGLMPGLMAAHFFNDKNGIVAGDSTPAFPCGIFTTTDGGRSWKPLPGMKDINWTAMDFRSESCGVLAGSAQYAILKDGKMNESKSAQSTDFKNHSLSLSHGGTGNHFAIANDGTLMDFNSTASVVASNINTNSYRQFITVGCQPNAIAVSGKQLWVVGRPGTVVMHSPDEGKTWTTQETKSPCSLNAIQMIDETTGWAVGELGTILNTTDGGKTWNVQKTGGQRAAVLFVHANGADVPFDALAMTGTKNGHLCGVLHLGVNSPRLSAVTRECGGAFTDCLSNRSDGTIPLSDLVCQIRQWRPNTIVTDRAGAGVESDRVREAVLTAVKMAADPKAFPEHMESLKLAVHTVQNVYAIHPTTDKAAVQFGYEKLVPELADDVRDFCELAPSLLGPAAKVPAFRLFTRLHPSTASTATELVSDTVSPRGGSARRKMLPPTWPADYVAAKEKIAIARRKIESIVTDPEKAGGHEKALEQIRANLVGLPEDIAARTAGTVAADFARAGQWGLAREMHGFVLESFELYPEAAEAARWLMTFHTSSQVRRRIELGQVMPLPKSVFDTVDDPGAVKQTSHSEAEGTFAKTIYRFKTGEAARTWNRFALDLEPKLIAFGPGLAADPAVMQTRRLARERAGINVPKSESKLEPVVVKAERTKTKPKLDGKLDDEVWKLSVPICHQSGSSLAATESGNSSEVRFAYDDQFLYVAISNGILKSDRVPMAESRERDADQKGFDRVEFALDLDRSGGETAYRFCVDQRGCLSESCWGDKGWNPKWFVAFEQNELGWTAEIAIPLAELTHTPVSGSVWGLELTKILKDNRVWKFPVQENRVELHFSK